MIKLTDNELHMLRSYERGPHIWDASSLRPTVLRLDELGLIKPVYPEGRAHQLTDAGRAVLAGAAEGAP
jgi:hypothetical protein